MMNDEVEFSVKAKCGVVLQREEKLAETLASTILVVIAKDSKEDDEKDEGRAGSNAEAALLSLSSSLDR